MDCFRNPCEQNVFLKTDKAPALPTPALSTYMAEYISPSHQRLLAPKEIGKPPDPVPETSGKRILPTTFHDVYRNCMSASIGEQGLSFQDDTPKWKLDNCAAAKTNWVHPLSDRRKFIETQEWYLRKQRNEQKDSGNIDGNFFFSKHLN